jgi:hypothetical protein
MIITALIAAALAGSSPQSLPALGDEFDSVSSLSAWSVLQGDIEDGPAATYDVGDGVLSIVASHASWVNDRHAFYLWKSAAGDFTVTTRIRTEGVQGRVPWANWSLSGLLLRAPVAPGARENWIGWTVGYVDGVPEVERKTTRESGSVLRLERVPAGWIELRAVRLGPVFALLRRSPGKRWVLQGSYVRRDLPAELQVGIDAQSGYQSAGADLRSQVDWIRFADTGVPAAKKASVLAGKRRLRWLLPYLTR